MSQLTLPPEALSKLVEILARFVSTDHEVFIFGSRATGTATQWSDIDVGIEGPRLDPESYFALEEALEASSLPYIVEVVQFCTVSPEFQAVAKQAIIPLVLSRAPKNE